MLKVVTQYSYFNNRNIYRPLVRIPAINDKMNMVCINIGINIPYDHCVFLIAAYSVQLFLVGINQLTIGWITLLYIVQ